MYQQNEICIYFQQFQEIINIQNMKIKEIEEEIELLKKIRPFNIEKINYKFDQLKVERLEGTLNIGINPGTYENSDVIEEFNINGNNKDVHDININKNITEQIDRYLNSDVFKKINLLEEKYDKSLAIEKKEQLINDVRKQVENQVNQYIALNKNKINPVNIEIIEEDITKKLMSDINKALETFVKLLPKEVI